MLFDILCHFKNSLVKRPFFHSKKLFSSYTRPISITLNATHSSAKDAIDSLIDKIPGPYEVCILLVSRTYSPKELDLFPSYLFTKLRPRVLAGCVVDKVYTSSDSIEFGHGISLFLGGLGKKEDSWRFDEFCDNVQGSRREYKTNSVGRWSIPNTEIRSNMIERNEYNLNKFQSISTIPHEFELPDELKLLKENNISPDLFFLISDVEPYQFLESLDHHFPQSKKLGIIGSSTPFITGRPFSLFKNCDMLSKGIVGIAFTSMTSTSMIKKQIQVDHQSLCSIGEPLKITSCQGNIIIELDGLNPTDLLLKRFQSENFDQALSKETEYYLGIYDVENKLDESMLIVNKILSGDPVRGNMAIDTTKNLKNGQFVKFMYRKNYSKFELNPNISNDNGINLVLATSDRENMDLATSSPALNKIIIEKNIFGGISENGIIIGKGAINKNQFGTSWVCNVPYSSASLLL